jgi:protein-S-isoprenylcysteine O-methyltransferase Ste14
MNGTLLLLLCNYLYVGILPFVFFRRDGNFNLMWWVTGLPYGLMPLYLLLMARDPNFFPLFTEDFALARAIISTVLSVLSISLMSLTIGGHRVPLALWHQKNDAPKGIVTWGAYKFMRHPFYTSFLTAHIAAICFMPSFISVGIFLWSFFILNHTASREEKYLSGSEFGKEYKSYHSRTKRFFPGIY